MNWRVIGVTGLPCAGKSLAARLIASGEITGAVGELVKADDIGHQVLLRPEVTERLRERFGPDIIGCDAQETRRRIAERVFSSPSDLAWLEALVHPLVSAELDRAAAAASVRRPVVAEAALLSAAGMDAKCDLIVVIEADIAVRTHRAAARGWGPEELERRDRRLLQLFEPSEMVYERDKLIFVRNDADDNGLAGRLRAALSDKSIREARKDTI